MDLIIIFFISGLCSLHKKSFKKLKVKEMQTKIILKKSLYEVFQDVILRSPSP